MSVALKPGNRIAAWPEPDHGEGRRPSIVLDQPESNEVYVQDFRLPRTTSDLIRHFATSPLDQIGVDHIQSLHANQGSFITGLSDLIRSKSSKTVLEIKKKAEWFCPVNVQELDYQAPINSSTIDEKALPPFILHPRGTPRTLWDVLMLLLLVYESFIIPYDLSVGFTVPLSEVCTEILDVQDCRSKNCVWTAAGDCNDVDWSAAAISGDSIIACLFGLDIAINFRTAFVISEHNARDLELYGSSLGAIFARSEVLVVDYRSIAWKYATSWREFAAEFLVRLPLDLAGTLPLDIVLHSAISGSSPLTRATALLRVAKFFRIELFYIAPSHLLIFKTFFYFVLIAHLLSCLLLVIGSLRSLFKCDAVGYLCNESDIGNGLTWMTKVSITTTQDTSVSASEAPRPAQYMMAIYYVITTMATVGYGDIKPVTLYELAVALFIMVIGAASFSIVVGNLSHLIGRLDAQGKAFQQRLRDVTVYMYTNSIPPMLTNLVLEHYNAVFKEQGPCTELFGSGDDSQKSVRVVNQVGRALKEEILGRLLVRDSHVSIPILQHLFQAGAERCSAELAARFLPMKLGPEHAVFHSGHMSGKVFIILRGEVEIVQNLGESSDQTSLATLSSGNYFGENSLVRGQEIHPFTAITKSWCDLVALNVLDLEDILIHRPESLARARVMARLRWARLQAASYVHSCVATLEKQQGRTFPPSKLRRVMKRLWSDCSFVGEHINSGLDFTFSEIIGPGPEESRSESTNIEHVRNTVMTLSEELKVDSDQVVQERATNASTDNMDSSDFSELLAPSLTSCVISRPRSGLQLSGLSLHESSNIKCNIDVLQSINEDNDNGSTLALDKQGSYSKDALRTENQNTNERSDSVPTPTAEFISGISHSPAHISNLHLRMGGVAKSVSASKHRKNNMKGKDVESKLQEEAPVGAGRAEWRVLYKMLMAGLGNNKVGQKLLTVVAGKIGHFDWSRDWVDCHISMAAEAEKLKERYGSYAAAEQAFFRLVEEQLWPTASASSLPAASQASWDTQKLKNRIRAISKDSADGPGEDASHPAPTSASTGGALESVLGQLLAKIDRLEDATDVFRLYDELHSLNLALQARALHRAASMRAGKAESSDG